MSSRDMAERGRAYTELCAELRRQGPLWPAERALLLDGADALLFDEPTAATRRDEALELLRTLEANDRRTDAEALRLRESLLRCAAPVEAVALRRPVPGVTPAPAREKGATHAS